MNDQAREIKFRAWGIERGRMNDVLNITFHEDYGYKLITNEQPLNLRSTFTRKDDFILMQCTGLKDKNGVEIYEGDIVSYWGFVFAVVFQNGAFGRIEDGCFFPFYNHGEDHSKMFEVIGNIHENPEIEVSK